MNLFLAIRAGRGHSRGLEVRPAGPQLLHILQTVKGLTNRGVTLVSVTDGIDSSTAAGRMMIGVLGSLAEYELELTKERTALKRAASRANGTKFGRPKKVRDMTHVATARRMKADGHTGKDIARYLGVSRATAYRVLAEHTYNQSRERSYCGVVQDSPSQPSAE